MKAIIKLVTVTAIVVGVVEITLKIMDSKTKNKADDIPSV